MFPLRITPVSDFIQIFPEAATQSGFEKRGSYNLDKILEKIVQRSFFFIEVSG